MERKWWCFLLSSIFTFLLGLLSVLATRMAQSYLCAQGEVDPSSEEEKQRLKEEAKKLRLQGQNPDEAPDGDFMSEAKVGAVPSRRWAKKIISKSDLKSLLTLLSFYLVRTGPES